MKELKRKIEELQMLFLCQDIYRLVDKERYIKIQMIIDEALHICENIGMKKRLENNSHHPECVSCRESKVISNGYCNICGSFQNGA